MLVWHTPSTLFNTHITHCWTPQVGQFGHPRQHCSNSVRQFDPSLTLVSKDRFTRKLERLTGKTPDFSQLFMKLKVGANEETLLRKQKCAQDAKNVFGQFQKLFLLSRRRFCVFNICCVGEQTRNHLGNTEKTLNLNVSRMFPRLRTQATYLQMNNLRLRSKNVLLLSRLLTHTTLWATLTENVSAAMFPRLRRPYGSEILYTRSQNMCA